MGRAGAGLGDGAGRASGLLSAMSWTDVMKEGNRQQKVGLEETVYCNFIFSEII